MKLIVFGATGGTGCTLVAQAVEAGHDVTAFVRDAKRLADIRARVIAANLFDREGIEAAIRGRDVVFSALGTRPWRREDICTTGTRAIANAMAATGVRRLICLSSQGVGDSQLGGFGKALAAVALRGAFRDKATMERELGATDLEWTVVRPGLLTNGAPRGTWRVADGGELRGGKIARADVAAFMLQQASSPEWIRRRPTLVW